MKEACLIRKVTLVIANKIGISYIAVKVDSEAKSDVILSNLGTVPEEQGYS